MLSAVLGFWLAALPSALPEAISSFTLTCLAKAGAGLNSFGGIGGVVHAGGNRWWMASEGLPLIFPVELDLRLPQLRAQIGTPLTIHGDPRGGEFRKVEAIALCHDRLLIGTEAMMAKELKSQRDEDIRVVMLDLQGGYLGDLPLPEHHLRLRPGMGTFHYRGIQGLSCSPDGRQLLVSLQRQLQQDGEASFSRQLLFRWQPNSRGFVHERDFLVPLDHQLGMMDTELLGDGEALILENEVKPQQRNTLSRFRIDDGDDISTCRSLRDCPKARPAKKTVVLEHIERFSGVDLKANEVQFDALARGPVLADGRRTLLLVNDDDHCGTITNPTSSIAPGFAGTTFTRVILPPAGRWPLPP
ncbi:MAG: esterase-like activity of phytase family protein [Cyanobium sp.]